MDATRRQRRAWYGCDWANSVFSTSVVAVFFGPYLTDVARAAADETGSVQLLGVSLRPEAIFPGVIGLATLLLLGVLPVTAVATRRLPRAELLGALTLVGAGATMGLATVHGDAYVRGSVLFIVALVMLAASIVVIDTFLPELAARGERGRVSATASSAGFASACLVLALSFGVVSGPLDLAESTAVRLCLLLAGLWWLLFMIWPVIALRGMSTTVDEDEDGADGGHPVGLRRAARVLWRTPLVPAFLVAYLLYNNGLQGVSSLSGTFGSEALRIDEGELIVAVLITNAAGAVGALVAGRLSRRVGTLRVLAGCLVLLALTSAASTGAPAGSVPAFFALATLIGIAIGSLYPLSRAVFADVAPPRMAGASFAAFELVNRALSAFGLLAVSLLLQFGAGYRLALLILPVFLIVGTALLLRAGRRGLTDATRLEENS